jgi:hypothetical protein
MNEILCPDCWRALRDHLAHEPDSALTQDARALRDRLREEKTCTHALGKATCVDCGATREQTPLGTKDKTPGWHCLGSIPQRVG